MKIIKYFIIIYLILHDIQSYCCNCCKKRTKGQSKQTQPKKSIPPIKTKITPPIYTKPTKTKEKEDKTTPQIDKSKITKKKTSQEEDKTKTKEDKIEEKTQINIKINGSKNVKIKKIDDISSTGNSIINKNFHNATTIYETDIKDEQTKEQVENLGINIEYEGYESKPYILAFVFSNNKNYIIFCEDANKKFASCDYGLFRETSIESITICDSKNLENATCLFYTCKYLKNVHIINFNTQKLKCIDFMFAYCSNLEKIDDLKNINFENATTADRMFFCSNIKEIEINLNSKIESLFHMFENCNNLEKIKLKNFIFNSKIDVRGIIYGSYNIKTIEVNIDSEDGKSNFLGEIGKEKYRYDNLDKAFIKEIKKKKIRY